MELGLHVINGFGEKPSNRNMGECGVCERRSMEEMTGRSYNNHKHIKKDVCKMSKKRIFQKK